MNEFKDFGIKPVNKGFTGEKININKILNVDIIVEDFKEEKSKYEGKGQCLYMQIIHQAQQRVVFVGSKNLLEMIKAVPKEKFPFKTRIVKENERLEFT